MEEKIIRCILIDDEPAAHNIMENLLKPYSDVQIVAKCELVDDAVEKIVTLKPDLIFLDVEMPLKSGFDLVKEIRLLNLNPDIIFVTAYNQYAIEAIKAAAFDYLIKPVLANDLRDTLLRYRVHQSKQQHTNQMDILLNVLNNKIPFNIRNGSNDTIFINTDEIIYIEADGNYSVLYLIENKKEIVTANLGSIEKRLPKAQFYRISRKHILNLNYLRKIGKCKNDKVCILISNHITYQVPIPIENVKELQRKFENI